MRGLGVLLSVGLLSSAVSAFSPASIKIGSPQNVIKTIAMVNLPGGAFEMGAAFTQGQQGYPAHDVVIAPFSIADSDVTFDQYDAFAKSTSRPLPQDEGWGRKNRPVINVSWRDMQAFIAWLNSGTGRHFRLPSEAEWEYAARAGTKTEYYWGDKVLPGLVNVRDSRFIGSSPVKTFPPNPFGLYDMSGNVWQAVEDCFHPSYVGAPVDGSPWTDQSCETHMTRGGFYGDVRFGITVFARTAIGETFRSMSVGFRLAESSASSESGSASQN